MSNRQELDKLVMTDPLAYAVYNKSKIENQPFEVFLINLVLTQHNYLKKQEEKIKKLEELKVLADSIVSNITEHRADGLTLLGMAERYEKESKERETK